MDFSLLTTAIAWNFLPPLLTGIVQNNLYKSGFYPGIPPRSNSPEHLRDRKYIQIAVVIAYILYSLVQDEWTKSPNFYTIMGLDTPRDHDELNESQLRTRFRRLSVLYHPDKTGGLGEENFIAFRMAYDTLANPMKRFAYDRLITLADGILIVDLGRVL